MKIQGHKPILKGSRYECANCGRFLLDITSIPKLRTLIDIDPVKLGAVINRISTDPDLAERIAKGDPREIVAAYKFADKMNDFLMNPKARPDLQTPEAQDFLNKVRNKYWSPKTDELMPWLTREWKKGRVRMRLDRMPGLQFQGHPDYNYHDEDGNETNWHNLTESGLDHWADWYKSDHPSRRGKDIMQLKSPDMHQIIKDWDRDMRDQAGEAAQIRGEMVHSYPDGWSIQRLNTPKSLQDEGNAMGHCVGGYWPGVQNGSSAIYSLRDHHNEPHVTIEVKPKVHQLPSGTYLPHPDKDTIPSLRDSTMVQIQGKANEPPIPAYQKRIKDWMETIPEEERPQWAEQENWDLADLRGEDNDGYGFAFYHPGDYGLAKPPTRNEWDAIVEDAYRNGDSGWNGGNSQEVAQALARGAHEHDDFEGLQRALDQWHNSEKIHHRDNWETDEGNNEYFNHEVAYEKEHPPPDYADPESPYEAWEDEMQEAIKPQLDNIWRRRWEESPEKAFVHNTEKEMARVQQEAQQPQQLPSVEGKRHKAPHTNFSTGEPCFCTFQYQPEEWHTAAWANEGDPMRCPTCGDPIEHGKCKRCNWGGWSNAMGPNDPIADPTKEMKPFVGEP